MLRGDLFGQHPIGLGPAGVGVVVQHGHSVAGRFGQTDVAGNHRGVDLAGEVALDLFRHLEGQIGAAVEHGQQHPLDGQLGVESPLDQPHCGQQVAEALQGVVLALHRDQQGAGGAQGVDGEHLQGGGAVDEDIVVAGSQLLQGVLQQVLPVGDGDHFDAGPGQSLVGGEHIPVFCGDHRFLGLRAVDQHIVYIGGGGVLVHAHAGCGVGLRVKVAQKHTLSQGAEGGCDVHRRRGLAHAALLVDDGNDIRHRIPPEQGKSSSPPDPAAAEDDPDAGVG